MANNLRNWHSKSHSSFYTDHGFWQMHTLYTTKINYIRCSSITSKNFNMLSLCSQTLFSHTILGNHRPFFCSYSFCFPKCLVNGNRENVIFWVFFCLAKWMWDSSILLCKETVCAFVLLKSVPMYGCPIVSFSIQWLKDIWLVPGFGNYKVSINIYVWVSIWIYIFISLG